MIHLFPHWFFRGLSRVLFLSILSVVSLPVTSHGQSSAGQDDAIDAARQLEIIDSVAAVLNDAFEVGTRGRKGLEGAGVGVYQNNRTPAELDDLSGVGRKIGCQSGLDGTDTGLGNLGGLEKRNDRVQNAAQPSDKASRQHRICEFTTVHAANPA